MCRANRGPCPHRQWFGPLELSGWHLHGWSARLPDAHLQSPQHVTAVDRGRCSMMILRRPRPRTATTALSLAVGVLCTSVTPGPARATEPVPIAWRDDYGGALEEARASNRPIWIQFTGPWCPNCVRMERDSFPDADVIEHSQRSFVPLKLRSDVHEQLALGFNLSGLPATVLVAPTCEILAIRQGYLGPDELDQLLSELVGPEISLAD